MLTSPDPFFKEANLYDENVTVRRFGTPLANFFVDLAEMLRMKFQCLPVFRAYPVR